MQNIQEYSCPQKLAGGEGVTKCKQLWFYMDGLLGVHGLNREVLAVTKKGRLYISDKTMSQFSCENGNTAWRRRGGVKAP